MRTLLRLQTGGGIEISGMPADLDSFNATYTPTGKQVGGYPAYAVTAPKLVVVEKPAVATHHLFRHPEREQWHLHNAPFDPAIILGNVAMISEEGGPVPTGARTWRVCTGGNWVSVELTVRELDVAAAQTALKERRRKALKLPLTATDGECELAELAVAAAAAARAELEAAAARGEQLFTVGGAAVAFDFAMARARPGRLSALSVFLCKSVLYGVFVWARRALNSQKWRVPARAVRGGDRSASADGGGASRATAGQRSAYERGGAARQGRGCSPRQRQVP
jgi:hypothetical protein